MVSDAEAVEKWMPTLRGGGYDGADNDPLAVLLCHRLEAAYIKATASVWTGDPAMLEAIKS